MKATKIIRIPISEASAKIRTGLPNDDKPDYELPIWAGVVPMKTVFEAPIPGPQLKQKLEVPKRVKQ